MTVVHSKGIQFLITVIDGQTIEASDARGTLPLTIEDKPKQYKHRLQALKTHGFGAAIDLSKLKGKTLPPEYGAHRLWRQTIEFSSSGMHSDTLSDTMLVSLQKTCPVTGKSLGSMGKPPKVIIKSKPLFVCCATCSGKMEASPDVYLTKFFSAKGRELRPCDFEAVKGSNPR